MPDQGDIFGSDQTLTNQTPVINATPTKSDTLSEQVALLVGEGRKYKTVDELAKAYVAADDFMERLKTENATLREDVAKGATLDQVLKRLEGNTQTSTQDQSGKTTPTGLTAKDVAAIVAQQVSGMETQRTHEANLRKADAEMKTLFGEKAQETFAKEASTPEMKQALMALAAVSPDKFVALFRPQATSSGTTDTKTSVNTAALNGLNDSGRGADPTAQEFYSNLRKTKPSVYYSSAMQLQMNKAAQDNPKQFFGRDI